MLERLFHISERGSNVRTEVLAGATTFITMAYIIFLAPQMLSAAGMPADALLVSTCLAAALATFAMAFLANYPVALASGVGLTAFFAFVVVGQMGVPWRTALAAIFIEGIIFLVLSLTKLREKIINSIPLSLKHGITAGIGAFIALIGLVNGGVVVDDPATLISLTLLRENVPALLTLLGVLIIAVLEGRKIKGAMLIGMAVITIIAVMLGIARMPESIVSMPPSIAPIFMQLDLSQISFDFNSAAVVNFWIVVFVFFFDDFFNTMGTLVGVASRGGMLDENGHIENARGALVADAVGTCAGAVLGVPTVTSYVESSAGVGVGGRTGLTALVVGALFLLATFFSPIVSIVPACATAPALICVGINMAMSLKDLKYDDWVELLPSVAVVFIMPFTYSIANGIEFGIVSYCLLNALTGRAKRVSPFMWLMCAAFIAKEIFI